MPIEYKESDGKPKEPPAETALIPKSLLMGKEVGPGDRVTLEVTHVYEDEVEVGYAKEKTLTEESADELDNMASEEGMGGY